MQSQNKKRSITLAGRKTSITIEDDFWYALQEIASVQGISISDLIFKIDNDRGQSNLSSAIRVFVLRCSNRPTMSFDRCVDQLVRFTRSKTPADEALGMMIDNLNLYLATFDDPNVRFYERCRVRIVFADRAANNDLTIRFLRKVDQL
jgi:predicted DNA-binding ribbon-helix-helix protein